MRQLGHFIGGAVTPGQGARAIFNPATGKQVAAAPMAAADEIASAVATAKDAQRHWTKTGLQSRAALMLDLRRALSDQRESLIGLVIEELGKTKADASAEVERAIEILGQAGSIGSWYGAPFSPGVSAAVDSYEVRYPIGVIAAISPFNFPVLIPAVQSAMAIASGNAVVVKPSDRNPSATLHFAEILTRAGLPTGLLNVVLGGPEAVNALVDHPDVAGVSFVGSTRIARQIRAAGVAQNKRVQAFGGGKNHMVVMPDADIEAAANAAVSAAYGAAGQRCMAVSVVVAVGDIADPLVNLVTRKLRKLRTGNPADANSDVGPVITQASRDRIAGYLDRAKAAGAELKIGGSVLEEDGWYIAPTLIDHVHPGMEVHSDELFGPVLCVVRAANYDEAVAIIAGHPLGNGAAIFTDSGATARRFLDDVEAGQIGINIPIPFPAFFHGFGGWKDSAFTETKLFGPGALAFCTRTKTVTARWPDATPAKMNLGFSITQ